MRNNDRRIFLVKGGFFERWIEGEREGEKMPVAHCVHKKCNMHESSSRSCRNAQSTRAQILGSIWESTKMFVCTLGGGARCSFTRRTFRTRNRGAVQQMIADYTDECSWMPLLLEQQLLEPPALFTAEAVVWSPIRWPGRSCFLNLNTTMCTTRAIGMRDTPGSS